MAENKKIEIALKYNPIVEDIKPVVEEFGETYRSSIRNKTAYSLPDNPSNSGMKAKEVKPAFYRALIDPEYSMWAMFSILITKINDNLNLVKSYNADLSKEYYIALLNVLQAVETDLSNCIKNVDSKHTKAMESLIDNASNEYDTLLKIENAIKEEITNREQAIITEATTREIVVNNALQESKDYTTQAISNLVNGAGEALDTLQELAKALGGDPNFATTIATNIANTKSTLESLIEAEKQALQGKLETEVNARVSADETLQRNIDSEVTARVNADTELSERITNLTAKEIQATYDGNKDSNVQTAIENLLTLCKTLTGDTGTQSQAIESIITRLTGAETSLVEKQTAIEEIKRVLSVNDVDYDTLQEIVSMLKSENGGGITALANHLANTNNPHATTKVQVGLGNVDNTADSVKNVNSATKLTTARTIAVGKERKSFDGTANIEFTDVINKSIGGVIDGQLNVNAVLFANRYAQNNSLPSIIIDKPGTGYAGIGATGEQATIQFARTIDSNGSAWDSTQNYNWDFLGTLKQNGSAVMVNNVLPEGIDLNTIIDSGCYRIESTFSNGPFGNVTSPDGHRGSFSQLLVCRGGSDTVFQIMVIYENNIMWYRNGRGSGESWHAWREVVTFANVSTEASANQIVQRNSESQIMAKYINSNIGQENLQPTSVYIEGNNDSWIRKISVDNFINQLGLLTGHNGLKLVASATGALEPSNLANGTYLVLPLDGYNYFLWSDQGINGNRYMQSIGIWTVDGSDGQMNFSGANSYTFFNSACDCVVQCNLYKIN